MKNIDFTGLAYLGAIGIALYIAWRVYQAAPKTIADATKAVKETVSAAVDKVNPASPNNVIYQDTGIRSALQSVMDKVMPDPNKLMQQATDNALAAYTPDEQYSSSVQNVPVTYQDFNFP